MNFTLAFLFTLKPPIFADTAFYSISRTEVSRKKGYCIVIPVRTTFRERGSNLHINQSVRPDYTTELTAP